MALEGQWRGLASRLVADAQMIATALQHAEPAPGPAEAAELVRATHHVAAQLTALTTRIGAAYRDRLPVPVLDQFRTAVTHLRAVAVDQVADALDQVPARRGETT